MGNTVYHCLIRDVSFAGIECGYYDKPSHYHHNQIVNAGYEGISLFYVPGDHEAGRQYLDNMVVRNCRKGLIGKSLTNAVISDIAVGPLAVIEPSSSMILRSPLAPTLTSVGSGS
jgi:hypothetical protein